MAGISMAVRKIMNNFCNIGKLPMTIVDISLKIQKCKNPELFLWYYQLLKLIYYHKLIFTAYPSM